MRNSVSLNRLLKVFSKLGLSVSKSGELYHIKRFQPMDSPVAEVLLPAGYSLDKKAILQLMAFAEVKSPEGGAVKATFATPDIHPGSLVPVGAVVATTQDLVIPQAIGTDIHCGMRLHSTDLKLDDFMYHKASIVEKLKGDLLFGTRNLPLKPNDFKALFQYGLLGWLDEVSKSPLGQLQASDFSQLLRELERIYALGGERGSLDWIPPHLIDVNREWIRDSYLATIGGGNHFIEIQYVKEIFDKKIAFEWGVKKDCIAVMIHSGSRNVGKYVGNVWNDIAKNSWPKGIPHPDSGIYPVFGEKANKYLLSMNAAANYANLNRLLLAELVRLRLREALGRDLEMPIIYDSPHNTVSIEDNCFIHRKGATPAHQDQPVLIPGSMGTSSYLMMGLGKKQFLQSASHGAGRVLSRGEILKKHHQGHDIGMSCVECITLNEERKIEEAPHAYKSIEAVIQVQVNHKMVSTVARLVPIMTFKG